jgi:hypothetical protein
MPGRCGATGEMRAAVRRFRGGAHGFLTCGQAIRRMEA